MVDIKNIDKINGNISLFFQHNNNVENKASLNKVKVKESIEGDRASISQEAKLLFLESEKSNDYQEKIKEIEEMIERFKETNKKTEDPLDILGKCLQIALRIMKGDRVPAKDMQFLAENEPSLYSNALLLRQENDKPKTHDSLLEEEKDNIQSIDSSSEVVSDIDIESQGENEE